MNCPMCGSTEMFPMEQNAYKKYDANLGEYRCISEQVFTCRCCTYKEYIRVSYPYNIFWAKQLAKRNMPFEYDPSKLRA